MTEWVKRLICSLNDHAGLLQLRNGKWKCKKCGKEMFL